MSITIALAGNPNSGKTTLFNTLTGSNQFVGNWPGVTVEKKEGKLKGQKDVKVMDLPGIYSLSPYTLEEVVARNYLLDEKPDAILNIIDGTNIERNLYLSTQLLELGIPVVMAVNMLDLMEKHGDKVDTKKLGEKLGCEVVEISALKGEGIKEAAERAVKAAKQKKEAGVVHEFSEDAEAVISRAEDKLLEIPEERKRFFAIKLLEGDDKIASKFSGSVPDVSEEIKELEKAFDDDAESIITNERYTYITSIIGACVKKGRTGKETLSDKIDKVVTNRILGLPIFVAVMALVYYVSMQTFGSNATDWANDQLFGDDGWNFLGIKGAHIPGLHAAMGDFLESIHCADWLAGLINDGIIAGVGAVLGFVPQILTLFLFLAFLESCGYMARVAFIMDRIFRKFGLSGKSFIPMLIGSGCGIPGIMASRTIESDRDRKMTIMTTTFVPCGAKMPIIGLIAGAFFKNNGWVATSAYFIGVAAIIISGIILKKTKMFAGDPAPFVMELPEYHLPTVGAILRSMWERGWSFIKKAGTIILLSTIVIWFMTFFGWSDGKFGMLEEDQMDSSILAGIGKALSWIFVPLGFGKWKMAVAALTGLVAKENVVGTFGILFKFTGEELSENGDEIWGALKAYLPYAPAIAAYSYMIFNLLCAPCFAAMGAIKREMNNVKWFWFAIGYQCALAYMVSLAVFRIGVLFAYGDFSVWTVVAFAIVIGGGYLLFRPYKESSTLEIGESRKQAA